MSLTALGRQHTADEALAALDLAKRAFDRVSFDLIYAREGQSVDDWRAELGAALTHAADVERTHRQLSTRFADALGSDNAYRHALFDH